MFVAKDQNEKNEKKGFAKQFIKFDSPKYFRQVRM